MTSGPQQDATVFDTVKLMLAAIILIGGIAAYYVYENESILLRAAGVIVATALAIFVAMQTDPGRTLWRFIQGSRIEIRKVVWPTRPETLRTAAAVIVFVLIMAVFFWGLDMFLFWATRTLTGRGG